MWGTFIIIVAISIPAIMVQAKQSILLVEDLLKDEAKKISPKQVFAGVIIQNSILIVAAALFGSYFLNNLPPSELIYSNLGTLQSLIPGLIGAIVVSIYIITLYYLVFRKLIGEKDATLIDKFRMEMGLTNKVLSGGIFEEVFIRFGIQSFIFWIMFNSLGKSDQASFWIAILVSSLIFGAMHIPSIKLTGASINIKTILSSLILNFGAGVVFGYLFFSYGLFASIMAHALLHVIWHWVDVKISSVNDSMEYIN